MPGTTLDHGRYRLLDVVGRGATATVWRATDTVLGVERAVKILDPRAMRSRTLRRRLLAEARTMAQLDHPGILRVYDIGRDEDRDYIVMDLVKRGTLTDQLDAHGPLSPRAATGLMIQVLDGLHAAHLRGIVHRDVKPQNLLVVDAGSIVLCDFGIALLSEDQLRATRTGVAMGSLAFMAPEQRLDARTVTPAADVYACGTTLYNLVTAANPVDLFTAEPDSERWRGVPLALAEVLRRATAWQPSARYPTARALAEALDAIRAELPGDRVLPGPARDPELHEDRPPRPPPPRLETDDDEATRAALVRMSETTLDGLSEVDLSAATEVGEGLDDSPPMVAPPSPAPAEQVAAIAPSAEDPSAVEPVAEEPGAEEPGAEEPGAEEPGAEEPAPAGAAPSFVLPVVATAAVVLLGVGLLAAGVLGGGAESTTAAVAPAATAPAGPGADGGAVEQPAATSTTDGDPSAAAPSAAAPSAAAPSEAAPSEAAPSEADPTEAGPAPVVADATGSTPRGSQTDAPPPAAAVTAPTPDATTGSPGALEAPPPEAAPDAATREAAGAWAGSMHASRAQLELAVAGEGLRGTLRTIHPTTGAVREVPVAGRVEGRRLLLRDQLEGDPTAGTYDASLSSDGTVMEGTFHSNSGGRTFRFKLSRGAG